MKKYLILALILLLGGLVASIKTCNDLRLDRNRLSDNQSVLMDSVRHYRTEAGLSAASVERLVLKKGELEDNCSDLTETIKSLNIKVKRLESATQTSVATQYPIKDSFKDSIVYRDGRIDTLHCISFINPWLTFAGCEKNGVFDGTIRSVDSLTHLVHRVPRKFWFIKYGTKGVRLEVVSNNPYSTITYVRYIELKR